MHVSTIITGHCVLERYHSHTFYYTSLNIHHKKILVSCDKYRVSQNYVNTDFNDRIRTVVSSIPREMCVQALNGTVARWLLCVQHDGEQVETVQ